MRPGAPADRIAVLGTGAIGAPIGGLLTRAGRDVVLIDQWPEHVEAMRRDGLRVTIGSRARPEAEPVVPVSAMHVSEVCTLRQPFDLVFLACKSYDTRWMVELIAPWLADGGVLVSVQNSLNEEWIAPIVGRDRVLAGVLTAGGELLAPGHAWRNRGMAAHYFTIGELDGQPTRRLDDVARILRNAGVTSTSSNVWGARWSKLITNTASAALSGLVHPSRREWDLVAEPAWAEASAALYREGLQVAAALGQSIEPLFGMRPDELLREPEEIVGRLMTAKADGASEGATTMIQQDLQKGRPTEVTEYFNGLLVRKGREAGVETPWNGAMVELYRRIERGDLRQELANLALLERLAAGGVATREEVRA